jgi:N-acetylmuramic acid-specific PTS system IIC component
MFGIILSCIAAIYILRFFEKYIRGAAAFAINPILTLLTLLFLNILLIFPVSGYIVYGLSFIFQNVTIGWGAPFGCALLAGVFLLTLMFGVHTSFIPIYAIMYKDGLGSGLNTIFPLLGMAGAAQVGAGFFLMLTAQKDGNFRKRVKGLLVSGILGIDEPLLFGVELPRVVPLITCCIAAMIPGCYIGIMNLCHIDMGIEAIWGQNGIFGLLMTTSKSSSM